ncbi:MAG: EFR1 family ferrodoxin [Desulforegulaceae bacterium]|nr:EFR1 family ferrodoxin [Desulforegulaceae bacterium]
MFRFKKAVIAYISPGGSTNEVALTLKENLSLKNIDVSVFEVGRKNSFTSVKKALKEEGVVFFPGSPVYVSKVLPTITKLIKEAKTDKNIPAVPFVTWGCVTSGIALYDVGRSLKENGFKIAGALKVPGPHTMMTPAEDGLGVGHPDNKDKEIIAEFVDKLLFLLESDDYSSKCLTPDDIQYQPEDKKAEMEKGNVYKARENMPQKIVSESLCTLCGVCVELCPVEAITLEPYPVFHDNCISCFNCHRKCPEEAVLCDLAPVAEKIKQRKKMFDEADQAGYFINS